MSRLRRWVYWKLEDRWDDWCYRTGKPDRLYLTDQANRAICTLLQGHDATMDHCGIPDHDYCVYCSKSMPGQAQRPAIAAPGGDGT